MKFDLDISGLAPGDSIPQSVCESVIGFTRASDRYGYQFQLLQLQDYLTKLLWSEGNEWTLKQDNGQILILTHEQASVYNEEQFLLGIAKMRRSHKRLVAVDISKIPVEKRPRHDETVAKQARILRGLRSKKEPEPELIPVQKRISLKTKAQVF